jgi:hypothetical protein
MSSLIPQTAPTLHIQPLPEGYLLASGEWNTFKPNHSQTSYRTIRLTAWMPDNFATCYGSDNGDDGQAEDEFFNDYCHNCIYYFEDEMLGRRECRDLELEDSNGNPVVTATVESQCPCYNDGIGDVEWPCAAGYDGPDCDSAKQDDIDLPPMAFAIDIRPFNGWFVSKGTSAWCQKVSGDGLCSDRWRTGNAYDNDIVCWGNDNDDPDTLALAAATYADAPGNADLISPLTFTQNRHSCRQSTPSHPLPGQLVRAGYDALLAASAADTPATYLLLRGSGIPADDGLIVIGLIATSHTLEDGSTVPAYRTEPTANGRCWLVINDPAALDQPELDGRGLLLGQLPSPPEPCTSTTPSSSALAAAAAS